MSQKMNHSNADDKGNCALIRCVRLTEIEGKRSILLTLKAPEYLRDLESRGTSSPTLPHPRAGRAGPDLTYINDKMPLRQHRD